MSDEPGFNDRLESALAVLDESPEDTGAPPETEDAPIPQSGDDAPEQVEQETELSETDDRETVIDPPDSWPADAREKFAALPSDLKQVIAEREAEQKSAFNRTINEAAEAKRKAESTGQHLAETLNTYLARVAAFDPILSEGMNTDWTALAREDPIAWVERKAAYDQRIQDYSQARAQQEQLAHAEIVQRKAVESQKLLERIPEWKDQKAYDADRPRILEAGKHYGFTEAELSNVMDHRAVAMLRDAMLYRKGQADKTALEAKKVVPFKGKTQAPGRTVDRAGKQSIIDKISSTTNLHDRAALVASMIGD